MAGRMINGAAALAQLIKPAGETDTPGVHRVLPVVPELSALLPGRGLRRGSTVAVATGRAVPGGGSTSLLLALLAEASRAGSWCAVVGMPALGALAAAESGVVLDRLALVPDPGPDWPTVVAALIDGVDVVAAAVPGSIAPTVAGRLAARARQRGSVLVPLGDWSGADVTLQVTAARWEGLGAGRGRLRRRQVSILAHGRGAAARPKEITLWMPGFTFRPPLPPPRPSGPGPGPGSGPATPGAPGSHPGTPNGFGPSPAGSLSSGPLSSGSLSSGSLSSGSLSSGHPWRSRRSWRSRCFGPRAFRFRACRSPARGVAVARVWRSPASRGPSWRVPGLGGRRGPLVRDGTVAVLHRPWCDHE
jgi:hypothetical protein